MVLNSWQTWWVGVVVLSVPHFACATNEDEARRYYQPSSSSSLTRDSAWLTRDDLDNAAVAPWADDTLEDAILDENEAPVLSLADEQEDDADEFGRDQLLRNKLQLILGGGGFDKRTNSQTRGRGAATAKRFGPSGFLGSRGKRFMPGLESLLLAKYYQDAAKWKRQPHGGFHGSRG